MKYFRIPKLQFDGDIYPGSFVELDNEEILWRALIILPEKRIGSNFPEYFNPYNQRMEITLPEGPFETKMPEMDEKEILELGEEYESIVRFHESIIEIREDEFEVEWNNYLMDCKDYWIGVQNRFTLGRVYSGRILVFYPIGVLVELGEKAIGLIQKSDYELHQKNRDRYWGSGEKVEVMITDVDDSNMWLNLKFKRFLDSY